MGERYARVSSTSQRQITYSRLCCIWVRYYCMMLKKSVKRDASLNIFVTSRKLLQYFFYFLSLTKIHSIRVSQHVWTENFLHSWNLSTNRIILQSKINSVINTLKTIKTTSQTIGKISYRPLCITKKKKTKKNNCFF